MSARDRLNAMLVETAQTRETLNAFVKATQAKTEAYSYAAGYLQSLAAELIMELPKAKREEYRAQLERATHNVNS